ncbi:MAG TPA: hypothetical protein VFB80_22640, partial [Pirellulaceae bacterium]|nr:hypothetical protein [Pirellulaceae bacterium]
HPPEKSAALARHFRDGLTDTERDWKPESALDDLLHALGCLRWGLARVDFDKLDLKLQTGLDEAPTPAPLEPPPPSSARDLIATLQDDPELGAVARLAHLLLAAVQLPRALSDPDELPIGGVSDIANRGSLDRLLLSELASDDLTLAVRVAMNEALYLRRESPPKTPPRQRRLLLDAGLRTWGVPRIFVAAVGLAVAAKTDAAIRVEAFRAADGAAAPVDLNSADGLKQHLAALDHRLHPAASVASLSRAESDDPEMESDLIVVTTDDTLADADFHRELRAAEVSGLFLASVSRDGRFELAQKGLRGSKVICRAKFDLDEVLKPRPKSQKLLDPARGDLPAFLQEPEPPLRFSCQVDVARSWLVHPQTVISYTRDGRLLLWDDVERGARQVASGLAAAGTLLWCDSLWDHEQRVRLVIGKRGRRGLWAVTLDRSGKANAVQLQLTGEHPQEVIGLPGAALVIHNNLMEAMSWRDGELLACRSLHLPQRRGRFFSVGFGPSLGPNAVGREWRALSYHADRGDLSIHPELVYREPVGEPEPLLVVSDCVGVEGPVGVTAHGRLIDLATGMERHSFRRQLPAGTRTPLTLTAISRDGQRFLVRGFCDAPGQATRVNQLLLDSAPTRRRVTVVRDDPSVLEDPMLAITRPRVTHSKFRAIGLYGGGLALLSRRGQAWPILHHVGQGQLRFAAQPLPGGRDLTLDNKAAFQPVESWSGGWSLERAQWQGGSVAWLDGRGLLHLRSSDQSLPEITLVLCDGPMAGWLSDGQSFGATYWIDRGVVATVNEVYASVIQRFIRQLA